MLTSYDVFEGFPGRLAKTERPGSSSPDVSMHIIRIHEWESLPPPHAQATPCFQMPAHPLRFNKDHHILAQIRVQYRAA